MLYNPLNLKLKFENKFIIEIYFVSASKLKTFVKKHAKLYFENIQIVLAHLIAASEFLAKIYKNKHTECLPFQL